MDKQKRKLYRGTLCILYQNGRYLMRFETAGINKNMWIFPGGSYKQLESGRMETGSECTSREAQEETGLTPLDLRYRARVFFDNHLRIFPGEKDIADFDYDATYFQTSQFSGEFRDISPDGRKQAWFPHEEAIRLPMHEGDRELLRAIQGLNCCFEAVIVHEKDKLKQFHLEFLPLFQRLTPLQ